MSKALSIHGPQVHIPGHSQKGLNGGTCFSRDLAPSLTSLLPWPLHSFMLPSWPPQTLEFMTACSNQMASSPGFCPEATIPDTGNNWKNAHLAPCGVAQPGPLPCPFRWLDTGTAQGFAGIHWEFHSSREIWDLCHALGPWIPFCLPKYMGRKCRMIAFNFLWSAKNSNWQASLFHLSSTCIFLPVCVSAFDNAI